MAVHSALARWWDLAVDRRTPSAAAALVRSSWVRSGFRDEEQSERWRAKTAVETAAYAERLVPHEQPLGIERQVSMRTPTLVLTGRVDRLDDRDGELVVVDYKTSRAEPPPDEARTSLPLGLYAAAVAAMFRRAVHPGRAAPRAERHGGRARAHAGVVGPQGVRGRVDRPGPGPCDAAFADGRDRRRRLPAAHRAVCGWCDFRRHCPEGQAVSTEKSGWAALEP